MSRLLLIDNYDSFTFNLAQAFQVLGAEVFVHRNDQIDIAAAQEMNPTHLCISPGPGRPDDAGVSMDMIAAFQGKIPILGVCLGHQSISKVFGGKVVHAKELMHGKDSPVYHHGRDLSGPTKPISSRSLPFAGRTGRWCTKGFVVDAYTSTDSEVMGIRHKACRFSVCSFTGNILTPHGDRLLQTF